jgi:hypothetical protein
MAFSKSDSDVSDCKRCSAISIKKISAMRNNCSQACSAKSAIAFSASSCLFNESIVNHHATVHLGKIGLKVLVQIATA